MRDVVSPWYADFVDISIEELQELISAANYLDIRPLLEVTWATVAAMMKGKSVEEYRKLFNIENNFTPEEEEQIKEENRWIDEAL